MKKRISYYCLTNTALFLMVFYGVNGVEWAGNIARFYIFLHLFASVLAAFSIFMQLKSGFIYRQSYPRELVENEVPDRYVYFFIIPQTCLLVANGWVFTAVALTFALIMDLVSLRIAKIAIQENNQ